MKGGFPLVEVLAAFLGANFVFSRFEKIARYSVAKGVWDGMFDLQADLASGRDGALAQIPREARVRVRGAIDDVLRSADLTRDTVRRNAREFEFLRRDHEIVRMLRSLG